MRYITNKGQLKMIDEIINYHDLSEQEKDKAISQLEELGFTPACGGINRMKNEMEKSQGNTLPQYIFVRRNGEFIGYMFLIAESEKDNKVFPWWAVDNSDELPLATDIRLLQFGIEICKKAECFQLAERLQCQLENHKKYIGRRPEEVSR